MSFYPLMQIQLIRLVRITTYCLVLLLLPEFVSAQTDQDELARMQQQLEQLQRKMASKSSNMQENARVRAVGGQSGQRRLPARDEVMEIRMYDLSDVFVVSPHYAANLPMTSPASASPQSFQSSRQLTSGGGGLGGGGFGGGGVFRLPPRQLASGSVEVAESQVSMTGLIEAIKRTVAPTRWGDGDQEAKIVLLGNTMLITATAGMHEQTNNLLNLFREHWGKRRTISVQTFWIRGSITDSKQLVALDAQESLGAGVVEQEKFEEYLKAAKTDKRVVFSARMTGHNNQTLHTFSGKETAVTIDGEPLISKTIQMNEEGDKITSAGKIVGIRPLRAAIFEGPVFQATPLATRGGNFVILDLHAQLNGSLNMDEEPKTAIEFSSETAIPALSLQHSKQSIAKFSTTIRCPKNQVLLAGSMTTESASDSEEPNLLIFVKTTVHTITEDVSDWANGSTGSKREPTKDTTKALTEPGEATAENGSSPKK